MIITIVMEQYGALNNGTTATAMRLGKYLMQRGHEVRVITCSDYDGSEGEKIYKLEKYIIPLFNPIVTKQGMNFARVDEEIMKMAIIGSDLVHIILPFNIGKKAKEICKLNNIPYTTAFHCQPENISSTLHLNRFKFINNLIYKYFLKFYDEEDIIHCPSQMIADQLKAHGYKSEMKVISNGITDNFKVEKIDKPEEFKGKIVVVSAGRFSREKRHDLVIDAVCKSKYHQNIVLILCGKGLKYESLKKRAEKLDNPTIFKFCTQEELVKIFNYADFYMHTSDAEIEGLACMEAFACGLVPLISDSKISATGQFALDEHCLFKAGSSKDLAQKLDYMIEHPELVKELKKKYVEEGNKYRIDKSIDQMIEMFLERIHNHDKNK